MRARALVVVIDACGVGALPDAAEYGDAGTNTLLHVAQAAGGLQLPALGALGLGSILELPGVPPAVAPRGLFGRLAAQGPGKDSTAGHRELMGVVAERAAPTYPQGFPEELVARLEAVTGLRLTGNVVCDGLEAIDRFGANHLQSGEPILYTSQDSVLQLAAHVDRIAPEDLYQMCGAVRRELHSEHAVGRVIARPFAGGPGEFARTDGRRDFSLAPPAPSYLDLLTARGVPVHGVGKVTDLFAGRGVAEHHPGATNARAIESADRLLARLDHGLVFVNLVETDQAYGHRKDVQGFHRALRGIDAAVAGWLGALRPADLLVVTADHGCDPAAPHTDHTREHVPLLAVGAGLAGRRHDGPMADVGATVHRWLTGQDAGLPGTPFS